MDWLSQHLTLESMVAAATTLIAIVSIGVNYLQKINRVAAAGKMLTLQKALEAVMYGVKAGVERYGELNTLKEIKSIAAMKGLKASIRTIAEENGQLTSESKAPKAIGGNGQKA